MRVPCSFVLVSALMSSAYAEGDALVDMLGPREIAVGEAMRGGATGATSIGLNPSGIPLTRELVFEGGFGYRVSDAASMLHVSLCDSTSAIAGCFYYSYAGAHPELAGMETDRRTHTAGGSFAKAVSPKVFVGSSIKYLNFDDEAMPSAKASGWNWDVGTTALVSDIITVGITGYNLWGTSTPEFARAVGGGVLVRPMPSLAVGFDTRWKLLDGDKSVRYGGGAELFLSRANGQTGFPLRLGGLRDNGIDATYLSGGLGIATMKWTLDVAARYAVSGTDATTIIASMRFFGPRLRAGSADGVE